MKQSLIYIRNISMNIFLIYMEYIPELIPKLKSFSNCSHKDKDLLNGYCHIAFYKLPTKGPHWHKERENVFL